MAMAQGQKARVQNLWEYVAGRIREVGLNPEDFFLHLLEKGTYEVVYVGKPKSVIEVFNLILAFKKMFNYPGVMHDMEKWGYAYFTKWHFKVSINEMPRGEVDKLVHELFTVAVESRDLFYKYEYAIHRELVMKNGRFYIYEKSIMVDNNKNEIIYYEKLIPQEGGEE